MTLQFYAHAAESLRHALTPRVPGRPLGRHVGMKTPSTSSGRSNYLPNLLAGETSTPVTLSFHSLGVIST